MQRSRPRWMEVYVTKRLLHTRRCTPPTLSSDPRALLSPVKSSPRPRRQDMPCAKHNTTPRASHAAHAIDAHVIRGDNLRHACPPGTRPYHLGGNSPGTRSIGVVGNTACRVDQAPPSNPQTLPSQCPMLGGAERQSGKAIPMSTQCGECGSSQAKNIPGTTPGQKGKLVAHSSRRECSTGLQHWRPAASVAHVHGHKAWCTV